MRNSACRFGATSDLNDNGFPQIFPSQRFDLRRHCRAEQQRLSVARNLGHDAIELRRESHVEHPVRFVENEYLEIVEGNVLSLHVIQQSARRCDHDIDAMAERFRLGLNTNAAEDRHDAQLRVLPVLSETRLHLRSKLAGWSEDQNANTVNGLPVLIDQRSADQIMNDGKCEASGFPGSSLCQTNQIASGESERNRLLLDWSGMGVADIANRVQQLRREAEGGKGHPRPGRIFNHLSVIYPLGQMQLNGCEASVAQIPVCQFTTSRLFSVEAGHKQLPVPRMPPSEVRAS